MNTLTKSENIIDTMIKNKLTIALIVFVFLAISIFLTGFQKREYSSQSQILIIQEQGQKLDAYIAEKASESIAKNLKKAINSSSFRNRALEASPEIDFGLSNKDEKTRRKEWQKIIEVKVIPNTSILEITAYNSSPFQAEKLMNNINAALFQYHKEYHGGGDEIKLQIVDYPLTSRHATRPNWILNIILSFILAMFFSASFCSLFPNKVSKINNALLTKDKKNGSDQKNEIKKVFNNNENQNYNTSIDPTSNEIKDYNTSANSNPQEVANPNHKVNISEFLDKIKTQEQEIVEDIDEIKEKILGADHYLKRKE